MTERERLIELIGQSSMWNLKSQPLLLEQIADHLLANGVMLVDTDAVCLVTNREPIRTAFGIPLDELAELIRAKQDGRIIVPPCKVGDTYYTIQRYCNTDPYDTEKEPVMAWDCEKYCGRSDCSFSEYRIEEHKFGTVDFILRTERDFGKTVFLTKEEAEKALERSRG